MTGKALLRKYEELIAERHQAAPIAMALRTLINQPNRVRWEPVEAVFDKAWASLFAQQSAIEARLNVLREKE